MIRLSLTLTIYQRVDYTASFCHQIGTKIGKTKVTSGKNQVQNKNISKLQETWENILMS